MWKSDNFKTLIIVLQELRYGYIGRGGGFQTLINFYYMRWKEDLRTAGDIKSVSRTAQGRCQCIRNLDDVPFFNCTTSSQKWFPATFTEKLEVLHVIGYNSSMRFTGKWAAADFLAWMKHLKGPLDLALSSGNGEQVFTWLRTPAAASATAPLGWPYSINSEFSNGFLMAHVSNSIINLDSNRSWGC